MTNTLSRIRDLIVIVGIYLYFIAWVYVHFYYQQFGLSTTQLNIDYSSYLMYSFNVMISWQFLSLLIIVIVLLILRIFILWAINRYEKTNRFWAWMDGIIKKNSILVFIRHFRMNHPMLLIIAFLVLVFPILFSIGRATAIAHYRDDRYNTSNLKTIQFIFRKDADLLSPAIALDSNLSKNQAYYFNVSFLRYDSTLALRLLGESDSYYIVMYQPLYDNLRKSLPIGFLYFIDKKDILLSRVVLPGIK